MLPRESSEELCRQKSTRGGITARALDQVTTDHYNPVIGFRTIALLDTDKDAGDRLEHFVETKGLVVKRTDNAAGLVALAHGAQVDGVVLCIAGAAQNYSQLTLALRQSDVAPPLLLVADEADEEAERSTDYLILRPAPLARVLDGIERLIGESEAQRPALAFARLLGDAVREQRSGQLVVTAGGASTTIHMREGAVLFAEQDTLADSLGRRLLASQRINTGQFAAAVDLITERMVDNEQLRLGEALVELGALTADEVVGELRAQVVDRVTSCFALPRFHAELRPRDDLDEVEQSLVPPAPALILAGLRTCADNEVRRYLAEHPDGVVSLPMPFWEVADHLGLGAESGAALMALDEGQPLSSFERADKKQRQIACALLLSGLLEVTPQKAEPGPVEPRADDAAAPPALESFVQPPAAEPAEPPSTAASAAAPATVAKPAPAKPAPAKPAPAKPTPAKPVDATSGGAESEAATDASSADTRSAEEPLAKARARKSARKDPGAAERRRPGLKEQLSAARDKLLRGRLFSRKRDEAALRQRRLEAEREHQQAQQDWRDGDLKDARDGFARAAKLDPESTEYAVFSSWLAHVLDKKRSSRTVAKLRKLGEALYASAPEHPLANLVLGHVMRVQGRFVRAQAHLLMAQQADPTLPGIETELGLLARRKR